MMKTGRVLQYDSDPISSYALGLVTCMISIVARQDVKLWLECPECGGQFTKVVDVSRTNVVKCKHCKEKFIFKL